MYCQKSFGSFHMSNVGSVFFPYFSGCCGEILCHSKEDKDGQGRRRDYSPEERTGGSYQQMQGLNIFVNI